VELLHANAFVEVRRRGSHIVMQRQLPDTPVTVPVPDHHELKRGTLASIIPQSKLPRELFEQ
jgi:predicted RNA binding protein YcfA (HicA-like mRNA interferase family)